MNKNKRYVWVTKLTRLISDDQGNTRRVLNFEGQSFVLIYSARPEHELIKIVRSGKYFFLFLSSKYEKSSDDLSEILDSVQNHLEKKYLLTMNWKGYQDVPAETKNKLAGTFEKLTVREVLKVFNATLTIKSLFNGKFVK